KAHLAAHCDENPRRNSAEKYRRPEILAVDSLSLSPRAASPSFLSPRRVSLLTISLSLSRPTLSLSLLGREQPRVVVVAVWCLNYPRRVDRKKTRRPRSKTVEMRGHSISKNGRLRIEAPVRLSHTESWREEVVIQCKGGPHLVNRMLSMPGQATPQKYNKKRDVTDRLSCVGPRERLVWNRFTEYSLLTPLFPLFFRRTISVNVDGNEGNAPEVLGPVTGHTEISEM
ncbi:hypothetical protein IGI04_035481, partial [Brassica rapa subsp. trilocularis]